MGRIIQNEVGNTYGQLLVLAEAARNKPGGRRRVQIQCSCGAIKDMNLDTLRRGNAVSCGCYNLYGRTTHGETGSKLYHVWDSMKRRCNSPDHAAYDNYGGRGISVCVEWENSYEAFRDWALKAGYIENSGLSIDRADNNLGYTPENCRWSDDSIQARNSRSRKGSSSKYIGVYFDNTKQKWVASILVNKKLVRFSGNDTELAAAIRREQFIIDNNLPGFTKNGVV